MYLFAIVFFSTFVLIEAFDPNLTKKYKAVFAALCYFFLIFHDGFRWETGCDWIPYSLYFENLLTNNSISNPFFEVGFYLFMLPIRLITDNYSLYLIIHAVVFYTALFVIIFRLSPAPFLSILLLYMITVPIMGTNRQLLALAFYIWGLYHLTQGDKIRFCIMTAVACCFHMSAFLCFFVLFLNRNIKQWIQLTLLTISILIAFSGIVNMLVPYLAFLITDDTILMKFDVYTSSEYTNVTLLSTTISLARKLIWIGLLMLFDHYIKEKPRHYYLFYNLYFISILFYIFCNGTILQILVSRALIYFSIAEIFVVPYVVYVFAQNRGKALVILFIIAYAYISIEKSFSNYGEGNDLFKPYKGILINNDYQRYDQ